MTVFDEIAEKTGDDQWEEWKKQVLGARDEIAAFVSDCFLINAELCWDTITRFADDELEETGIDDSAFEIISTMHH
jgi:hypothetical protein